MGNVNQTAPRQEKASTGTSVILTRTKLIKTNVFQLSVYYFELLTVDGVKASIQVSGMTNIFFDSILSLLTTCNLAMIDYILCYIIS